MPEKRFMENYGLKVEVVLKNAEGRICNTGEKANALTLSAENKVAQTTGCLSFV